MRERLAIVSKALEFANLGWFSSSMKNVTVLCESNFLVDEISFIFFDTTNRMV